LNKHYRVEFKKQVLPMFKSPSPTSPLLGN